ncbi:partial Sensor protein DivL, partial [Rhodocyclaceae bacterium]
QILRRILGNLVKNALEATPRGGTVTLSCTDDGGRVIFGVTNPGVMPEEVQLQIFQRSFSTKAGTGRGIGTYSVKLFGERYLKGKVAFTSREPEGTTFTLSIPKRFS